MFTKCFYIGHTSTEGFIGGYCLTLFGNAIDGLLTVGEMRVRAYRILRTSTYLVRAIHKYTYPYICMYVFMGNVCTYSSSILYLEFLKREQ